MDTPPGRQERFAEDNNECAIAMYARLRPQPGNLFFSPFSIRTALAMAHAGARGETAAQMERALCIRSQQEHPHDGFAETVSRLNAVGTDEYEMAVANSLWVSDGAPPRAEYLELVARHYGGIANVIDFSQGAEAARVVINRWVENRTRQKIRDVIPPGGLDATSLVLVNAVYFKGMWALPFRNSATHDEPFYREGGGKIQARLMHQLRDVLHTQAQDYQAVDLLYRGSDVSMLILLPDRKDGLADLENDLLAGALHDCVANMVQRTVSLFLPRFQITWGTVNVREQLRSLGMPLAFTPFQADFSGINGHEPPHEESLFVSDVFHKATVEVNEEGTTAAAAPAVGMRVGAAMTSTALRVPPTFRADHPFLFAIRDRTTGAILFLGRVTDPTR